MPVSEWLEHLPVCLPACLPVRLPAGFTSKIYHTVVYLGTTGNRLGRKRKEPIFLNLVFNVHTTRQRKNLDSTVVFFIQL
jgi:hypothetical protein